MMAFEVGGVPTTTLIGTDQNNLNWTVNHATSEFSLPLILITSLTSISDTQLMLSVVDSNGSAGGIPPRLYTVVSE